jgi:hypothetical protein
MIAAALGALLTYAFYLLMPQPEGIHSAIVFPSELAFPNISKNISVCDPADQKKAESVLNQIPTLAPRDLQCCEGVKRSLFVTWTEGLYIEHIVGRYHGPYFGETSAQFEVQGYVIQYRGCLAVIFHPNCNARLNDGVGHGWGFIPWFGPINAVDVGFSNDLDDNAAFGSKQSLGGRLSCISGPSRYGKRASRLATLFYAALPSDNPQTGRRDEQHEREGGDRVFERPYPKGFMLWLTGCGTIGGLILAFLLSWGESECERYQRNREYRKRSDKIVASRPSKHDNPSGDESISHLDRPHDDRRERSHVLQAQILPSDRLQRSE